ncbi:hypothetical protein EV189_0056 [Motilibacter rhizosphaerae]|uniref:Uncharacterized protein n=1 Tax=Motilibacter rhizosphaerae TaxID=598652 RepID=A0A4Q7NUI4_9ACTN|nr:hypothetical protein [Motilibacter rhizosphaerae]RZS90827.1 hypothetical protein EV189_0056 [Motilibacter rhizosphaerae]
MTAPLSDKLPDAASEKAGAAKDAAATTAATAKDEASGVAQQAAAAGGQVASTAKDQASQVLGEAASSARDLLGEAKAQGSTQAVAQKDRAVGSLRTLADELQSMVDGGGAQGGVAGELARQASSRAHDIAGWIESREPGELLEEAKDYARRKPGTFLIGAAIAGVLAGRLTRGTVAAAHQESSTTTPGRHSAEVVPVGTTDVVPATGVLPTTSADYAPDTYAAAGTGTGYPTNGLADPTLESLDVRTEATGIGYGGTR